VTFPRIMGPSIANEMLLLGKKFSAVEARDARLVCDHVCTAVFVGCTLSAETSVWLFRSLV
jgi:enoyl-CoA hydratase/carnithine racemase